MRFPLSPVFVLLTAAVFAPSSGALAAPSGVAAAPPPTTTTMTRWPALPGLQPSIYLQKRNRDPDISADLRALPPRLRVDVALAILASDDDALPLAPLDSYPRGWEQKARDRQRSLDIRAARTGALLVLGETDEVGARSALIRAIDEEDVRVAAIAAERLGQHKGAKDVVDVLLKVARDDARAIEVRSGACAGLGRHRGPHAERALEALLVVARDERTPKAVVDASWQAALNLGSAWAWQARGEPARGLALRARARAAGVAAPAERGPQDAVRTNHRMP
jgi:hypothetical protein